MLLHWLVYTSVALFALAALVRPSCCEVGQTVNYSVMMHWLAGGVLLLAFSFGLFAFWLDINTAALFALVALVGGSCCEVGQTVMMHWLSSRLTAPWVTIT